MLNKLRIITAFIAIFAMALGYASTMENETGSKNLVDNNIEVIVGKH